MALDQTEERHIKLYHLKMLRKIISNTKEIDEAVIAADVLFHKSKETDEWKRCNFSIAKKAGAIDQLQEKVKAQQTELKHDSITHARTEATTTSGHFQTITPHKTLAVSTSMGLESLELDFEQQLILTGVLFNLRAIAKLHYDKIMSQIDAENPDYILVDEQITRCEQEAISDLSKLYLKQEGEKAPLFTFKPDSSSLTDSSSNLSICIH